MKIMKSYWCLRKHTRHAMMTDFNFNPALAPCKKAECEKWNEKQICFYCKVAGK